MQCSGYICPFFFFLASHLQPKRRAAGSRGPSRHDPPEATGAVSNCAQERKSRGTTVVKEVKGTDREGWTEQEVEAKVREESSAEGSALAQA